MKRKLATATAALVLLTSLVAFAPPAGAEETCVTDVCSGTRHDHMGSGDCTEGEPMYAERYEAYTTARVDATEHRVSAGEQCMAIDDPNYGSFNGTSLQAGYSSYNPESYEYHAIQVSWQKSQYDYGGDATGGGCSVSVFVSGVDDTADGVREFPCPADQGPPMLFPYLP